MLVQGSDMDQNEFSERSDQNFMNLSKIRKMAELFY